MTWGSIRTCPIGAIGMRWGSCGTGSTRICSIAFVHSFNHNLRDTTRPIPGRILFQVLDLMESRPWANEQGTSCLPRICRQWHLPAVAGRRTKRGYLA